VFWLTESRALEKLCAVTFASATQATFKACIAKGYIVVEKSIKVGPWMRATYYVNIFMGHMCALTEIDQCMSASGQMGKIGQRVVGLVARLDGTTASFLRFDIHIYTPNDLSQ
jgi:hypothetical protein